MGWIRHVIVSQWKRISDERSNSTKAFKHKIWYYDWVYCCFRSSVNIICGRIMIGYPIIIRPHIVFTDGRQRQPIHNTTTYCAYWRTTTTTTQSVCGRIMIGLSLSSVSKHNMWSYYDWVYNHNTTTYYVYWRTTTTINSIIIRPHIVFTDGRQRQRGRIMIELSLLSSVSKHNRWSYYDWVYCSCCPSVNTICGRINTYCVYWRTTTTTTQS
jgi:hypothetical protein